MLEQDEGLDGYLAAVSSGRSTHETMWNVRPAAFGGSITLSRVSFTVVKGGQGVDATGQVVNQPDRVLDNQSGQFVEQGAKTAPKYETGKVYVDGQGRKAKWDGTKFVAA